MFKQDTKVVVHSFGDPDELFEGIVEGVICTGPIVQSYIVSVIKEFKNYPYRCIVVPAQCVAEYDTFRKYGYACNSMVYKFSK